MLKRVISFLLCFIMIFSLVGCNSNQKTSGAGNLFNPGTYEGTAKGFNGDITAIVTVSDNEIENIEFKEHQESIGVSDPAFNELPDLLLDKQTVALDTITGCTVSSQGILDAVKTALLAAGVDEADITKSPTPSTKKAAENFHYDADVVIIGGGGSGMTAAYEVLSCD